MHIIALESHARDRHVSKIRSVILDIYASVAILCTVEVSVIDIQRETGIIVVGPNLRPWSCRFTSPQVKEAYLMPDEASDLALDRG
nr:hypothetical protein [Tanacetum cinerariifolium]